MLRAPAARGAFPRGFEACPRLHLIAAAAVLFACVAIAPARADEVRVPGGAMHPPERIAAPERARSALPATVYCEGLYSYTTPFAEPRWLRLQQDGDVLWGTIDINGPFGFCSRERLNGWISGDQVNFDVSLQTANCPCSGAGASLSFSGTVDGYGNVTGTWTNNCVSGECGFYCTWSACELPDPPENGVCDPLPENDPPYPVALVPGAGALALAALALALVSWPLVRRRWTGGSETA